MTDLSTTYLGLNLKNPLVASASPLSKKIERARKLEEAGISAIVMYSLFEEQIIHESLELDHYLSRGTDSFPEALSYLPMVVIWRQPGKISEPGDWSEKGSQHSRHWKLEWRLKRRLDKLRPQDPGSWCRCSRT